ncbi:hypothetical protein [Rhodopseudomonas sp.]|uniref:hypothetical protein n=1 Tax=Rhodopseudomonas sp. TaxID=1078 RepID=UPI003B3BD091
MGARARVLALIGAALVTAGCSTAWAQTGGKHEAGKAMPPATSAKAAPKKPAQPMTRREEIQHAIDTRTVPEHYRSSVPKEYQKYIPFEKHR